MANELLKSHEYVSSAPSSNRMGRIRRSSSSNMTSPTSLPPTPVLDRTASRNSGYFDFGMDLNSRARGPVTSPMRPVSRDASSSSVYKSNPNTRAAVATTMMSTCLSRSAGVSERKKDIVA